MIYLVDGHNLIPKIPGLSLQAEDDEMQLVDLLQYFAREKRKKVEVYFDRAAIGQAGVRKFGTITAHFVHSSSSADQAIRQRLERSAGKRSGQPAYCVVSSDHAVQNSAKLYHARVQTSESFVAEVQEILSQPPRNLPSTAERKISDGEVQEWLDLFNGPSSRKQE